MKGKGSSTAVVSPAEVQNENVIPDENSSVTAKTSPTGRKSLIPLLKEKSTPTRPALTPNQKSGTPTRAALTPLQKSATPKEIEMVGRKSVSFSSSGRQSSSAKIKIVDTPRPPSGKSKLSGSSKVRSELMVKKGEEKISKATNSDVELITGDEPTLNYWKELAETRRQALSEALVENESLHNRVEYLENENKILEALVDEAKKLAELINSISEDDLNDESGIEKDSEEVSHNLTA